MIYKERAVSKGVQMMRALNKRMAFSKEESYPISFIGTGPTLNDATTNGLERAAKLFDVKVEEIQNRSTITGSIDIGRHPGVTTITFLAPREYLEKKNLLGLVKSFYD